MGDDHNFFFHIQNLNSIPLIKSEPVSAPHHNSCCIVKTLHTQYILGNTAYSTIDPYGPILLWILAIAGA